jgi:hypothetical protein
MLWDEFYFFIPAAENDRVTSVSGQIQEVLMFRMAYCSDPCSQVLLFKILKHCSAWRLGSQASLQHPS